MSVSVSLKIPSNILLSFSENVHCLNGIPVMHSNLARSYPDSRTFTRKKAVLQKPLPAF